MSDTECLIEDFLNGNLLITKLFNTQLLFILIIISRKLDFTTLPFTESTTP